jgi:hypothetical protein
MDSFEEYALSLDCVSVAFGGDHLTKLSPERPAITIEEEAGRWLHVEKARAEGYGMEKFLREQPLLYGPGLLWTFSTQVCLLTGSSPSFEACGVCSPPLRTSS